MAEKFSIEEKKVILHAVELGTGEFWTIFTPSQRKLLRICEAKLNRWIEESIDEEELDTSNGPPWGIN